MWVSWGSTALMIGISIAIMISGEQHVWLLAVVVNAVWMISALFTVRGYRLQDQTLFIQRLFWETKLELQDLEKAYLERDAFRRSFKTFGNGGLFSFSGYFKSKKLGTFRCWVTDQQQSVVLIIKGKTRVISPGSPESFLSALGIPSRGKSEQGNTL